MDWIKEELDDFILIKDEKGLVCILHEDEQAKAQLISKAPEILEELKIAVKALKAVNSLGATKPIIERWENLIKEATTI